MHQLATHGAPGLRVRVFLALAAAPFVIAVFNGNTFALHTGMDLEAPAAASPGDDAGRVVDGALGASGERSRTLPQQMPTDHDAQHALHAVGACLALLGAASLLLLWRRICRHRLSSDAHLPPTARATVGLNRRWWPPPLSPPTSSPVIRT